MILKLRKFQPMIAHCNGVQRSQNILRWIILIITLRIRKWLPMIVIRHGSPRSFWKYNLFPPRPSDSSQIWDLRYEDTYIFRTAITGDEFFRSSHTRDLLRLHTMFLESAIIGVSIKSAELGRFNEHDEIRLFTDSGWRSYGSIGGNLKMVEIFWRRSGHRYLSDIRGALDDDANWLTWIEIRGIIFALDLYWRDLTRMPNCEHSIAEWILTIETGDRSIVIGWKPVPQLAD